MQNKNKQLQDQLEVSNEKNKADRKKIKDAVDEIDDLKKKVNDLTEQKKALEETVSKKNFSIQELAIKIKNFKEDLERVMEIHKQVINTFA